MNVKTTVGAIIIVILIAVVAFLLMSSSLPGSGYKVIVQGRVGYNPITKWSITYDGVQTYEDTWMPFAIGETGDLKVEVYLIGEHTYHSEISVGRVSNIIGGERGFGNTLRNVQTGTYHIVINLYEVFYLGDNPLFNNPFSWPESGRNLVKTFEQDGVSIP